MGPGKRGKASRWIEVVHDVDHHHPRQMDRQARRHQGCHAGRPPVFPSLPAPPSAAPWPPKPLTCRTPRPTQARPDSMSRPASKPFAATRIQNAGTLGNCRNHLLKGTNPGAKTCPFALQERRRTIQAGSGATSVRGVHRAALKDAARMAIAAQLIGSVKTKVTGSSPIFPRFAANSTRPNPVAIAGAASHSRSGFV